MISSQAAALAKLDQAYARARRQNTDPVSIIDFPKGIKSSKCATHTHRHVLRARHGVRIIEDRTIRVDTRKRHSSINCVSVHTTLVR